MIIVKLMGGLGNQMFEYALYRSLKEKFSDANVYLDMKTWVDSCRKIGITVEIQIDTYNIVEDQCTTKQKDSLMNDGRTIIKKISRKLFGEKKSHVFEQKPLKYDSRVWERDNVYLDGYWQTSKYFDDIRDILLSEFTLKIPMNNVNNDMLHQIENTNAVSVHVRRGDYLNFSDIYGGICTKEYYINALDYVRKQTDSPVFYLFSDDINWCREEFASYADIEYVEVNDASHGYFDLELMRNCKHNIIANSSFSWWGAWLNENPEKIVIAPKKWINGYEEDEICPEDWIRL